MFFSFGKKVLHLVLAFGFIAQIIGMSFVQYADLEKNEVVEIFFYHKSLGLLLLFFSCLFFYCAYRDHPGLSPGLKKWERILATTVHLTLYFALLMMPLSGVLMSFFAGKSLPFFNIVSFPVFFNKVPLLSQFFHSLHHFTAYLLYLALPLHIAGTIKHLLEGQRQHLKIFKFF